VVVGCDQAQGFSPFLWFFQVLSMSSIIFCLVAEKLWERKELEKYLNLES
jgi:hypothetical protein